MSDLRSHIREEKQIKKLCPTRIREKKMLQYSMLSQSMAFEIISKKETNMDKGKQCPRCKGSNTDMQNNIWYCYDCQKEF